MKELTKKLLEAGVVGKTISKMMERWGMLSPEELQVAMQPKAVVAYSLENFIEELELLNQPEAIERKEVNLDTPIRQLHELWAGGPGFFTAAEDNQGRLLVHFRYGFKKGELLYREENRPNDSLHHPEDASFLVLDVDSTDKVTKLTVQKLGE